MFDVNGFEFLILLVLAVVVLGPERLPEYSAKLARLVRQGREMAERAQTQLKDEMGDDYKDIDWKAYDPRQYDPRRIVRDALSAEPEPDSELDSGPASEPDSEELKPVSRGQVHDPSLPTPWDLDAT